MVKPPRIRHSKPRRDPVTIDLDPSEVKAGDAPTQAEGATEQPKAETIADITAAGAVGAEAAETERQAGASAETADAPETPGPAFGRSGGSGDEKAQEAGPTTRAAPENPRPTPEPKPAEPRRGGVSAIAAGLIGAAVALAGGAGLQIAGLLPSPGATGQDMAELDALRASVARLEETVAANAGGTPAASDPQAAARVDAVEAALQALRGDIEALKTTAGDGSGQPAADPALTERLAALETRIETLSAAPAEDLQGQIASGVERMAAIEGRLDGVARQAGEAATKAGTLGEQIAGLQTRLDEIAEQQAASPRIALAIAAAGLKAAIDRGQPFMAELEAYAAVAPDAPEIAALRDLAAAGVATRAEIAGEADDAAVAMIAASKSPDPEAGFFSSLISSAESLVTVRPVGEVEGDGVPAIAARIEAAVKADDYARAIAEYETLPDAAKAAGAGFIGKVRARLAADDLVAKALAGAIKA